MSKSKQQSGHIVLHVDDDPQYRDLVAGLLGPSGIAVQSFGDAVAALDWQKRNPPALLITDLQMPIMDGFTLVTKIRAMRRFQLLPIILFSNADGLGAVARNLGAIGIPKIEPTRLRDQVQRIITAEERMAPMRSKIDSWRQDQGLSPLDDEAWANFIGELQVSGDEREDLTTLEKLVHAMEEP
jgi:CheY-like chemotaxis protein